MTDNFPEVVEHNSDLNKMDGTTNEKMVMSVSREHNSRLPISSLPSELLVKIFELVLHLNERDIAVERDRVDRHYETLHSLVEVCRVWRDFILQTSALWTMIGSNLDARLQLSVLARSKDALLDVYSSHWGGQSAFLESIKPHCRRWRSLRLARARARDLDIIEGCVVSELRALIVVDSYGSKENRHPLLGDEIERLGVSGLSIPRNFKGLIELELINVAPYGPSLDDMIEVLTCSSLLIRLILKDFIISPGSQFQPVSITLPALKHLFLSKIGILGIDHIASSINGSVCEQLVFQQEAWGGGGMSELFLSCPTYISSSIEFMTRSSNVSTIYIRIGFAQVVIEGDTSVGGIIKRPLKIDLPTTSALEVLAFLSTVCFHGCEIRFTLERDLDDEEFAQFLSFARMNNITMLSLRAHRNSVEILRDLSIQHDSLEGEGEGRTWTYPSLVDLRFYSPSAASALQVLKMIDARYGTSRSLIDGPTRLGARPPRKLKYLEISGIRDVSDLIASRLEHTLGDCILRVHGRFLGVQAHTDPEHIQSDTSLLLPIEASGLQLDPISSL